MAEISGIPEKRFRQALRDAALPWHAHNMPWVVEVGSPEHADMQIVLQQLTGGTLPVARPRYLKPPALGQRDLSDEAYIIGLCDSILGREAIRQHKFDFLRGDPGKNGKTAMLPVDAWYPDLALVIEYRERQHTEAVALWDGKPTVSGVNRGEQRPLYDQRRRDVLPTHGIRLIEFDVFEFQYRSGRKLVRCPKDRHIIAAKLKTFV
jgi:hypothetical protein